MTSVLDHFDSLLTVYVTVQNVKKKLLLLLLYHRGVNMSNLFFKLYYYKTGKDKIDFFRLRFLFYFNKEKQ